MDVQQFEQAILKLAFETNTRLTAASVAYYMGMPTREASRLLNALLEEGVLELDSDLEGNLYYRVPHQSEISAGLKAPSPAPQPPAAAGAKTDVEIVEEALAREEARLVSLDDEDDAPSDALILSPRRFRPNQGAEGSIADGARRTQAPARAPRRVVADVDDDPVAHAVVGRGASGRRGVVLEGSLSSAADGTPGMGYGRRGVATPLVSDGARCEHKPLPEARPVLASCATAQDEPAPVVRAAPAAHAQLTSDWWSRDQGAPGLQQGGAMVLAGAGHMPVTMDHIEQPEHQPGMALLLSLILCGTGQIYNGEVSKGITMMVLCFLLWFVLLGWVVHIWSIVDAVVVAERISRRQQAMS